MPLIVDSWNLSAYTGCRNYNLAIANLGLFFCLFSLAIAKSALHLQLTLSGISNLEETNWIVKVEYPWLVRQLRSFKLGRQNKGLR